MPDKSDNKNSYDNIYGKGKTRRDNMAFSMIKGMIIGSISFMILAIALNIFLMYMFDIGFFMIKPIEIFVTALVSFLMMAAGYFFRGSSEK